MRSSSTVGIIANPASARDIRRIVAHGGSVTTHDKLNRLRRVLAGLGATGVEHVISMADRAGLMAGLASLSTRASATGWPTVAFVDQPVTHTADDTTRAVRAMVEADVGSIVVLGGDGTNRLVAARCGDTPIVSLSTGTNNAFPQPVEATVAGMAAGLVALHSRCRVAGTYRAKKMSVRSGDRVEEAVVDVAVSAQVGVGTGAMWEVSDVSELFLCFAEPGSVGLSAIGSHIEPTTRRAPTGVRLRLSPEAATKVVAPIAPGLVTTVGVDSVSPFEPSSPTVVSAERGVIAIDGERMVRFGPDDRPTVTLSPEGPIVVDVAATLDFAARNGLLMSPPGESRRMSDATTSINQPAEPREVST